MFGFGNELDNLISQTCEIVSQDETSSHYTAEELNFLVSMLCHCTFGGLRHAAEFTGNQRNTVLVKAMIKANYLVNHGRIESHMMSGLERLCDKLGFSLQEYSLEVYNSLQK